MLFLNRAIKSTEKAGDPFSNIQELLKNAIFLKQQIKYEENRRYKILINISYLRYVYLLYIYRFYFDFFFFF